MVGQNGRLGGAIIARAGGMGCRSSEFGLQAVLVGAIFTLKRELQRLEFGLQAAERMRA
jgi:hypothetical protein